MINQVLIQFHLRLTMKSQFLLMLKGIFHTQPSLLSSPQLYICMNVSSLLSCGVHYKPIYISHI